MVIARPRYAPRAVVLAVVVVAGLTGCSATNPMTTMDNYDPSDGSSLTLDQVRAGNLMVLTSGEGEPGILLGYVANGGTADVEVGFALEGAEPSSPVRVDAGRTALLGPDKEAVEVAAVPSAPGTYVELTVTSDAGGSSTVQIPVMDDTHPEYADLVP